MHVRGRKTFPIQSARKILIRGTNWLGDVVMTLPAVASVKKTLPGCRITVLARPWVADLYRLSPAVDSVLVYERPGRHEGIAGLLKLAGELRQRRFDAAILLQNAIEAAIIAVLAGIPVRAGYNSDGRGFLLTHSVARTKEIRRVHQIDYYLEMLTALGFTAASREAALSLDDSYREKAAGVMAAFHVPADSMLIGMAPGAAYGPAKMWFAERFAAVADRLIERYGAEVLLFGSAGDLPQAERVRNHARHPLIDLTGKTNLAEAVSMIAKCSLFISNDSGLMHVAGALGVPLVAVFGSTNPATTSPPGMKSVIVRKPVDCSPCLKKVCPTDFACMDLIGADDVIKAAERLLSGEPGIIRPA